QRLHWGSRLRAGVEYADRPNARITAQGNRHESAAGLAHDGDMLRVDLALEGRAIPRILMIGPVHRGFQVISCSPAAWRTRWRRGALACSRRRSTTRTGARRLRAGGRDDQEAM